ncbi:MAG TPA: hypothetical protein VK886_07985 [Vicinamibacterales bacterium]|nr:hypothetical protein [Vicinamibacterales bacterium]
MRNAVFLGVVIAGVSLLAGPRPEASSRWNRRGGPVDWSHRHMVAARGGPDGGQRISHDWRTHRKHARLERARSRRDLMFEWFKQHWPEKLARKKETSSSKLDWSLNTGGYGNVLGTPAKYSFDITAYNCSDVIYFTVDQAGSASAVNVVGITNPYGGCPGNAGGTTPTVKFGIAMMSPVPTSAVLSLDGRILYVIESAASGMVLHAILVDNITSNPGTYDFGTSTWTSTHTLAAPDGTPTSEQLFQLTYSGVTNTTSSPFLDYWTDQLYFGTSQGRIHRVLDAASSAAAKDPDFPVTCGINAHQSPVFYDGQVISAGADGYLYRINTLLAPPYTCVRSIQGGAGTIEGAAGGFASPVLDVTNELIVVVSGHAAAAALRGIGTFNFRFAAGENYVAGQSLGVVDLDANAPQTPAFDDNFWLYNNGSVYAVGAPDSGTGTYLRRQPYNAGVLGATAGYGQLRRGTSGSAQAPASPVTEFMTASGDFLYVGAASYTRYRFMYRIAAGFGGTSGSPVAVDSRYPSGTTPGPGVLSGIIIDTNLSDNTGGTAKANVYFGTVGVASTTQSTIVQLAQAF